MCKFGCCGCRFDQGFSKTVPEKNQKRLSPGQECDFCCELGSEHV